MAMKSASFYVFTIPSGTRLHTLTQFDDGTKAAREYFESQYGEHPEMWKHLKAGEFNKNFTNTDSFYFTRVHPFCDDVQRCPYFILAETILKRDVRLLHIDSQKDEENIDVYALLSVLRKRNPNEFDGVVMYDKEPLQSAVYLYRPSEVLGKTHWYTLSPEIDGYEVKHKEKELEFLSSAVQTVEIAHVSFQQTPNSFWTMYENVHGKITSLPLAKETLAMMKKQNLSLFRF